MCGINKVQTCQRISDTVSREGVSLRAWSCTILMHGLYVTCPCTAVDWQACLSCSSASSLAMYWPQGPVIVPTGLDIYCILLHT